MPFLEYLVEFDFSKVLFLVKNQDIESIAREKKAYVVIESCPKVGHKWTGVRYTEVKMILRG